MSYCPHAASGCNSPEGECLGLCLPTDWVKWDGGPCPVPLTAIVDYQLRAGAVIERGSLAGDLRWHHNPSAGDIIAYRMHKK